MKRSPTANERTLEPRNTCEDREFVAEYDSVVEELSAADHTRASLTEEMNKRESWAWQDRENGKATPFKNEANRYAEQAETHEAILANLRAKYEPAENTVNALQERCRKLKTACSNLECKRHFDNRMADRRKGGRP
ncbi:hypothetical protein [Rhodopirellula europaea]|uniref:hypothetical protein n=1 Tax=Rhodopirellula europaea TaxID=1263866 RepID=UPI003D2687C1